MPQLFQANKTLSQRDKLEMRYKTARANLLMLTAFTLLNVILVLCGSLRYFLFSANVPYYVAFLGAFYCGRLPAEYYAELNLTEADFLPSSVLAVCIVAALLVIAVYVALWYFSKKKVGFLIAAGALLVVDTVFMFWAYGIDTSMIADIIFHAWCLFYVVLGIVAHYQKKALPADEPIAVDAEAAADGAEAGEGESTAEATEGEEVPDDSVEK